MPSTKNHDRAEWTPALQYQAGSTFEDHIYTHVHFPRLLHKSGENLLGFCPIHVFDITPNKRKTIFNMFFISVV
jgi:hypothetical protein